jgi:hypothetical protein
MLAGFVTGTVGLLGAAAGTLASAHLVSSSKRITLGERTVWAALGAAVSLQGALPSINDYGCLLASSIWTCRTLKALHIRFAVYLGMALVHMERCLQMQYSCLIQIVFHAALQTARRLTAHKRPSQPRSRPRPERNPAQFSDYLVRPSPCGLGC